jgi:hypothetical protein
MDSKKVSDGSEMVWRRSKKIHAFLKIPTKTQTASPFDLNGDFFVLHGDMSARWTIIVITVTYFESTLNPHTDHCIESLFKWANTSV